MFTRVSLTVFLPHLTLVQLFKMFLRFGSRQPYRISRIELKSSNPACLLLEWLEQAEKRGAKARAMNLATATKNGEVSSRHVAISEITDDASIVFTSQNYTSKITNIEENPQVAATILLQYEDSGVNILKQIRYVLTKKSEWVDCDEFNEAHDTLLTDISTKGTKLEMPDTLVAYKIVPHTLDFYYMSQHNIGDRLVFTRTNDNQWKCVRKLT
ncbi:pyridoxine/pyridoxamine 5'-phosphate oxidase-like isoform X3 [Zophobas morio]|uniref:pyridoxine/pyridoxamine 5'-phosphate oxidase-like isoform X3 n=1 Tax=Zophobas morio TaxID=2755281 RepID=UPI003082AEFD